MKLAEGMHALACIPSLRAMLNEEQDGLGIGGGKGSMHAEACIMGAMQIVGRNGFWDWQKDGMHAGVCITGVMPEEGRDGFGIRGGKGCML
jgi:hypothetical protein